MTRPPPHLVADATVGIRLLLPEDLSDRAQDVFDQLHADPPTRVWVPDLFYIECANTLWKHVRRLGYPPADARRDARNLRALTLRVVTTSELMDAALDLAIRRDITAYDACYVVLSDLVHAPLITADKRLVRKLAGSPHDVRWLGDASLMPRSNTAGE